MLNEFSQDMRLTLQKKFVHLILLLVLCCAVMGCGSGSGSSKNRTPQRLVYVSPYTIPDDGFAAWQDAFDLVRDFNDGAMGIIGLQWSFLMGTDPETDYSATMSTYEYFYEQPEYQGLIRMYAVTFGKSGDNAQIGVPDSYAGLRSFTNPDVSQGYIDEVVWFADRFPSEYLAIGVEINGYYNSNGQGEWDALVAAYIQAYDQIKAVHPDLTVYMYFQIEEFHRENNWDMVTQQLLDKMDVLSFSSYPSSGLHHPDYLSEVDLGYDAAGLPQDYYTVIKTKFGNRTIVFTELGHPSAPSTLFTRGSLQDQADFIDRFFGELTNGLDIELVNWMGLHDIDYPGDYFDSIGLRNFDGTPKSGWDRWIAH